ncbi:unnamed protein product [Notodromas monacha]|uniref:Uncharacterized protein n=1 Tax=Notodromas monacha TaxID=399045 RepID=A0A7R9GBZ7_9CRUS|nr:unnamed protein product [Notodromas monacha]CAG0915326.1 unnamed protein product [Notodromas monacha]
MLGYAFSAGCFLICLSSVDSILIEFVPRIQQPVMGYQELQADDSTFTEKPIFLKLLGRTGEHHTIALMPNVVVDLGNLLDGVNTKPFSQNPEFPFTLPKPPEIKQPAKMPLSPLLPETFDHSPKLPVDNSFPLQNQFDEIAKTESMQAQIQTQPSFQNKPPEMLRIIDHRPAILVEDSIPRSYAFDKIATQAWSTEYTLKPQNAFQQPHVHDKQDNRQDPQSQRDQSPQINQQQNIPQNTHRSMDPQIRKNIIPTVTHLSFSIGADESGSNPPTSRTVYGNFKEEVAPYATKNYPPTTQIFSRDFREEIPSNTMKNYPPETSTWLSARNVPVEVFTPEKTKVNEPVIIPTLKTQQQNFVLIPQLVWNHEHERIPTKEIPVTNRTTEAMSKRPPMLSTSSQLHNQMNITEMHKLAQLHTLQAEAGKRNELFRMSEGAEGSKKLQTVFSTTEGSTTRITRPTEGKSQGWQQTFSVTERSAEATITYSGNLKNGTKLLNESKVKAVAPVERIGFSPQSRLPEVRTTTTIPDPISTWRDINNDFKEPVFQKVLNNQMETTTTKTKNPSTRGNMSSETTKPNEYSWYRIKKTAGRSPRSTFETKTAEQSKLNKENVRELLIRVIQHGLDFKSELENAARRNATSQRTTIQSTTKVYSVERLKPEQVKTKQQKALKNAKSGNIWPLRNRKKFDKTINKKKLGNFA